MSFAIEVPGAAAPLSATDLYKALQGSNAHDHSQRQAATEQLQAWQTQANFYSALQTAFLDRSLPTDVRLVAVIILKNGVDRNWRGMAHIKGGISADEKAQIRARLFAGAADESERALALHGALVAAKIVRIDYPQEWPTAMSELVALLRGAKEQQQQSSSPDRRHLNGVLLLLLRVIKELATARLRKSQTALQHVAEELAYVLGDVYTGSTAAWLEALASTGTCEAGDLATSLTALKVLRHLVLSGFESPLRSKLVQEFWTLSQTHVDRFLGLVRAGSAVPAAVQDAIGRHLLQLTKLHIGMCDLHPASFAALPNSVALVRAYWGLVARFADVFTESGGLRPAGASSVSNSSSSSKMEGPLQEKLALKGLLLLKSCTLMITKPLQTFKYRSEETQKEQAAGVQTIRTALFTDEFLLQVVDVIVTKLFVFRQSDLAAWDEDPEAWEAEESEAGSAWEWQVRPCAEKVFLSLLIHNKALLVPPLLAYLQRAMTADTADSDVLAKEAVYTAMGNAAVAIDRAFDFGTFVTTTLVADGRIQGPLAKILRRRIAILLGAWAFYELPPEAARVKFQVLAGLLSPAAADADAAHNNNNDLVVRLTAARQLKVNVDDILFQPAALQPCAGDVFASLLALLDEVENDDTKLAVLETMRVFIQRMEAVAAQFGDRVVAALPAVWAAAAEDTYMVKQAVLTILTTLIMALGAASQPYHALVLPLVADAMDPQSAVHQNLFEEALDLWAAVLSMTAAPASGDTMNNDLLSLCPMVLPLLEYDSPAAATCLQIVKAYAVLAPAAVLSDKLRRPTVAGLARAMATKRHEQLREAADILRLLVRAAARLGAAEGVSVVAQDMLATGFLGDMLTGIHGAWEAHQSTGPRARTSPISTTTETAYFTVLSQVALADPGVLVTTLTAAVASSSSSSDGTSGDLAAVWAWLAPEWFACVDNMGNPEHPKLACLALTRLCELALPPPLQEALVLGRLQDYFALWTSVVADAQAGDATQADYYVWAEGPPPPTAFDTPLTVAEAAEAAQDPVHVERTYDFVLLRLRDLMARAGGEQAFEAHWMANVDRDVLAGFQRLSSRR